MRRTAEVYIKYFDRKSITLSNVKKNIISNFFPKPLLSAFCKAYEQGLIDKDDWILGPIYPEGDFQIGVTGTVARNETYIEGMIRELGEEIGLIPITQKSLQLFSKGKDRKKRYWQTYLLNISNAIKVQEEEHNMKLNKGRDDKRKKVGCIVYGPKDSIMNFLESEKIYTFKDTDNIAGVAATNFVTAYNHFIP